MARYHQGSKPESHSPMITSLQKSRTTSKPRLSRSGGLKDPNRADDHGPKQASIVESTVEDPSLVEHSNFEALLGCHLWFPGLGPKRSPLEPYTWRPDNLQASSESTYGRSKFVQSANWSKMKDQESSDRERQSAQSGVEHLKKNPANLAKAGGSSRADLECHCSIPRVAMSSMRFCNTATGCRSQSRSH